MKKSEKLDKLAPALSKAQSEMGGAVKDSSNPFFKSKYADLTSVWKACKDALHSNNISVIQSPIERDGRLGVATMLLHDSGQYIEDEYTLGVKKQNDPQADGSSITYARRYALAAFVGVCTIDDDAEGGMNRNPKKNEKPSFVTKEQAKELNDMATRSESDYEKLFAFAGSTDFVTIPASKYNQLKNMLNNKIKALTEEALND